MKTAGNAFGTVETSKLKGQLQTSSLTKIEAETGTTFATLEFEAGCSIPSPSTVNGTLLLKESEGKLEEHLVKHLVEQGAGTSLYVGADTAEHLETSLVGGGLVSLAGEHLGHLWGGMAE